MSSKQPRCQPPGRKPLEVSSSASPGAWCLDDAVKRHPFGNDQLARWRSTHSLNGTRSYPDHARLLSLHGPAKYLAMRDDKPTVGAGRPSQPAVCKPLQVPPGRERVFDSAVTERRLGQP